MAKESKSAREPKQGSWWKKLTSGQRISISGLIVTTIALVSVPIIQEYAHIIVPEILATATITPTPSPSPTATPTQTPTPTPTPLPSPTACLETTPPQYGFECGLSGWAKTTFSGSQAVTDITTTHVSNDKNVYTEVLAIAVDFTGSPAQRKAQNREAGEAQVDLLGSPPAGYAAGIVNLSGEIVTAWVWASKGAKGDPAYMNGFQLFVKDKNGKSCYSEWSNIEREETWFRIIWREPDMSVKQADPKKCDPAFDSSQPKYLGLKVAVGDTSPIVYPAQDYLTVYMDDVNWTP